MWGGEGRERGYAGLPTTRQMKGKTKTRHDRTRQGKDMGKDMGKNKIENKRRHDNTRKDEI